MACLRKEERRAERKAKTAPLHTELRNARIIPNGKHICQPTPPHKKKERRCETEGSRVAPQTTKSVPVYYTITRTHLSTPSTRLFPRGSLKVRSERRVTVECLRRDDASADLVVGSHCRFVGDENGHAPHAVLFLGVYRPRVETVPQSAACAATDCPSYGVGGDARATRDFIDCPPFQLCVHG